MKCMCGWELSGNETYCPNCARQIKSQDNSEPYGITMDNELSELRRINAQLVESNRQTTQALNLVGQMVANGALLNFLKKR